MAEEIFTVRVEIDIDYEMGSPSSSVIADYDVVRDPDYAVFSSVWMTKEGPTYGECVTSMTSIYHPFTDTARRQVFCILTGSGGTITWGGAVISKGNFFLTTDNGWAASSIAIGSVGEGQFFACEGELSTDFRVWKQGLSENIAL